MLKTPNRLPETYHADRMTEGGNGRNPRKSGHDTLERLEYFIAFSELIEGLCLLLEKGGD